VKRLTGLLLVLCLLHSPPPTIGQTLQAVPEEPNFNQLKGWVLHFSLGIVAAFKIEGGTLYFSYPILAEHPVKECMPYRKVGNEIHLMDNGRVYIVNSLPDLYRRDNEDWKMWDELRRGFEE
jgi:hypothetical protein